MGCWDDIVSRTDGEVTLLDVRSSSTAIVTCKRTGTKLWIVNQILVFNITVFVFCVVTVAFQFAEMKTS